MTFIRKEAGIVLRSRVGTGPRRGGRRGERTLGLCHAFSSFACRRPAILRSELQRYFLGVPGLLFLRLQD